MRDHNSLKVTQFRGLFDRGEDEVVPVDHFLSCQNLIYTKRGFRTRYGSDLSLSLLNIRRIKVYRIAGQAQRLLILNSSYQLFDSTDLVVPILTITGMTDFSVVTMYDRAYITPHDGVKGLSGEAVYVYTGSGTARKAAGAAPTGFTLTADDSASSGTVEAGIHLFAVCYLTNSGHITKPGGYVSLDCLGERKVDIGNLPLGPGYISGRIILATKTLEDFAGDFVNQEWFFVPDGTLNDNTDDTHTIDFYDADLIESADYLLDALEEIPAGVCIGNYNARLIVGGENGFPSTLRVSKPAYPETVNASEGLCNINPGDAGSGVKNLYVHRETLVVCKGERTYGTIDTGDEAAFWKPIQVDGSIGTGPHGIGRILDYGETLEDISLIADRSGLRVFNGSFTQEPLTRDIEDYWLRVNKAVFHTVEVVVDPINSFIYMAIPLDAATSPSHVLFGDYSEGLNADAIKWCPWLFPVAPRSIVVDVDNTTKLPVFKFAGYTGHIYKISQLQTDDSDVAIDNYCEFALLPHEEDDAAPEGIYHFGGVNIRVKGSGSLLITFRSQDFVATGSAIPITLSSAPGIEKFRLMEFQAGRCAVKLRLASADEYMIISKFTLLSKWLWSEVAT